MGAAENGRRSMRGVRTARGHSGEPASGGGGGRRRGLRTCVRIAGLDCAGEVIHLLSSG